MRNLEILLALAAVVALGAVLAARLRLPAPSLLVLVGLAAGSIPGVPGVRVTPSLVSVLILPPLVYATSQDFSWPQLRHVWVPVAVLSVGLVAATAVAVAMVATALTPIPGAPAVVLGAVLASTDPVAVNALGRGLALPTRVRSLVQAESLFNDATSLMLFRVAVVVAATGSGVRWGQAVGQFVVLVAAGVAAGAVVGCAAVVLHRLVPARELEPVLLVVAPYAAYLLAGAAKGSGITAVVVAGLIVGHGRAARLGARSFDHRLDRIYRTGIAGLECLVFALIGLQLPSLIRALPSSERVWLLTALALLGTLLAVRLLWVFPLAHHLGDSGRRPVSLAVPTIVCWAGTRGAVPLAAALSIPVTIHHGTPFPQRPLILLLATGVIALTLIVQGLTLSPLARRLGFSHPAKDSGREETSTGVVP